MIISDKLGVNCRFSGEIFNAQGTVRKIDPFFNTVLNNGIFKLFTVSLKNMTSFINIGIGNTAPANTQTGLDTFAFSSENVINTKAAFGTDSGSYLKITKIFRFDIGSCTGTFKEVGLSRLSNTDYFNRQLFKNAQNDPIDIVVAADEGLLLTAELKTYLDPNISYIGEKINIDLKGATGGEFKFVVGTTESTAVTFAQFDAGVTEMKAAIKEVVDADLVVDVIEETNGTFTIEFLPLAGQTGVTLNVTNLTGQTEPPTVTITRENPKLPITFNVNDIDAGTSVVNKINRSFPMDTSNSLWGMSEVTNPLYTSPFEEVTFEINGVTPSSTERTPPTETTSEVTDVCVWMPGRISEDATFSFNSVVAKLGGKMIYEYRIVDNISIANTEEVKWTFKRGWGRWADISA